MILLDADHLCVLKYDEHPRCRGRGQSGWG